ncbi:YcxB family protein [Cohnella faecalis]|nr:YcxB family protein [Cohnella faecalis]
MDDRQPYEATVNLTAEDFRKYTLYQSKAQLVGLFAFYVCLIVIAVHFGSEDKMNVLFAIPVAVLVAGGLVWYQVWRIGQRVRKIFNGDRVLQLKQKIRLTEEGIHHETGASSLDAKWDEIYKVADSGPSILIYMAKNKAFVLPKRDLADLEVVLDLLKRHVPAPRLKLRR